MGIIELAQTSFSFIINIILTLIVLANVWLNLNNVSGILITVREVLFWIVPTMTVISIWSSETLKNEK
jgi:hypothetical protein